MLRFIVLIAIIFLAVIFFIGMFRKIFRTGLQANSESSGRKKEDKKKMVNARFEEIN